MHTELISSHEEAREDIIGAEGESMFASHVQRLRVRRLRWLSRFIEKNRGMIEENLRFKLMARFGLSYEPQGELANAIIELVCRLEVCTCLGSQ